MNRSSLAARGVLAPPASRRSAALTVIAAALALAGVLGAYIAFANPTPAHAEGPGEGTPTVVSLGDSYISGEAGRWAGNTNESSSWVDALGSTAYYDNAGHTAELIPGCHRSQFTHPKPQRLLSLLH